MKRFLAMSGVLFLVYAAVNAQELNVMTYNIRYGTAGDELNSWGFRRALIVDQIRRQAPDSLGLQEALRFQIDDIRKALPQYGEVGIGRDGGTNGEYSCILYDMSRFRVVDSGTFWLSTSPEKRSQDWDAACVRICTWALLADQKTGETFYHYNTHLDHQSAEARLNGVRLIADRIAAGQPAVPFVLTGDFNAAEDSPAVQYLQGETTPTRMVDTFRVLHPDATEFGTFNRFHGDKSGAKIDYILTAPETTVLSADIDFSMPDGRCISDHFPVTATLRFPAASDG